jgi:hypothetical protein
MAFRAIALYPWNNRAGSKLPKMATKATGEFPGRAKVQSSSWLAYTYKARVETRTPWAADSHLMGIYSTTRASSLTAVTKSFSFHRIQKSITDPPPQPAKQCQ